LHLHPGLQARVIDLFIDTVTAARQHGVELRLIIETHSETMINRIGHRIAENSLDADDVQNVLFEQARQGCSDVRLVDYDADGFLMDWPFGSFEPELV
jgi:predicted ATPase